jgi:hypothetical protein
MNGQEERRRIVKQIFDTIHVDAIVETGTYRGSSAMYFTKRFHVPVYTVEMMPRYFAYSRLRLRLHPSVHVRLGDSRAFLRSLAGDSRLRGRRIFFYLDAHWGKDLPLNEELRIIAETWTEFVVVIDDFQVPDDPGYGFDDYGDGRRLTADFIPEVALPAVLVRYPAAPSSTETGKRRGCIVLLAEALEPVADRLSLLREV